MYNKPYLSIFAENFSKSTVKMTTSINEDGGSDMDVDEYKPDTGIPSFDSTISTRTIESSDEDQCIEP